MIDPNFNPVLVCITGIDGCGKSTQSSSLKRWLSEELNVSTEILSVWGISNDLKFRNHPFISDRSAIHAYLETIHGNARALFILHAIMEAWRTAIEKKPRIILADGFWYKYVFTETLHGESFEWLLNVVGCFPRPHFTVLLDIQPGQSWERKSTVTPYECGFKKPTRQRFISFQKKLHRLFHRQAIEERWHILPGDRSEDDVQSDVRKFIHQEVLVNGFI